MPNLITLQEFKLQSRIDTDAEDVLLQTMIATASAEVERYVTAENITASPEVLKTAALVMASYLYRERDGSNEYAVAERYGYGYLPAAVTALLYPHRRPTFA